jgi:hypothetical protein
MVAARLTPERPRGRNLKFSSSVEMVGVAPTQLVLIQRVIDTLTLASAHILVVSDKLI